MRVTVLGATGFVGRRLCRWITQSGGAVTALVRATSAAAVQQELADQGVRLVAGDVTTGEGLAEAVRGSDHVIHLAAVVKSPSTEGLWRCNAGGVARLSRELAVLSSPPSLVVCSSLAAAGPATQDRPRREADPPAPVSQYGRSKLAGEWAARTLAHLVPTTVVRPPIVYGPGDPAFVPSLLPMIRAGLVPDCGTGPHGYSLVHVDDLCTALTTAAVHGRRLRPPDMSEGVYHVSDGVVHTVQGLSSAIAAALGRRPPRLLPIPAPVVRAAAAATERLGQWRGVHPPFNRDKALEMGHRWWTCSHEKACHELQFVPSVHLAEGMARLLARP